MTETVKVAVRVRPFNKRERQRNAKCIVEMNPPKTLLFDPEQPSAEPKRFQYDFSYWSFDGSKDDGNGYFAKDTSHANGKKFCDQKTVYADLGVGILNNAWEGYNSTLFAYGQTGSGKSWSIVGYGVNKGIVPQFCEEIFVRIGEKQNAGDATVYEVTFSMLEIYNEEVRDLLNPSEKRGGLKVRQHPTDGFYAEGQKKFPVDSYAEIEKRMEEGTSNRTVAATNMNATSSRAHTIVGITLVQKTKVSGEEMAKTSVINLVDLAGSERADSTGATGDRLKEGAAINLSLSALGNVISALADRSGGKRVRVPYRDSVLTKLLKNALGGNSKTIMIAAISPADINYEETLSTLRYADRAKQIKVSAKVNEDPTAALIRELQEENAKLKKMLSEGGVDVSQVQDDDDGDEDLTDEERAARKKEMEEDYREAMEENQRKMEEMQKSYEEKLKQARAQDTGGDSRADMLSLAKSTPHLSNLNPDPLLNGYIIKLLNKEKLVLGNGKGDATDIVLAGPSIMDQHAEFYCEKNTWWVKRLHPDAKIMSNGDVVEDKDDIYHNDRLVFGTTQYFVFINPAERDSGKQKFPEVTYESAQEEIAAASGFDMGSGDKDDTLLQEDIMEVIPAVEMANSISELLDKKKQFELMVVTPEARGEIGGRKRLYVNVTDLETGMEWVLDRVTFLNRKYVMESILKKHEAKEDTSLPKEKDPFFFDPNQDVPIGNVKVWLQSMAYRIESKEQLDMTDYRGQENGKINVEVVPCDKSGKEYSEKDDMFVEDPTALAGKDVNFVFKIKSARGLPDRFSEMFCKFKIHNFPDWHETKRIKGSSNPDFNFKKVFNFPAADEVLLKYLKEGAIMVQLWGKQKAVPANRRFKDTHHALKKLRAQKGATMHGNTNVKVVDPGKVKFEMQMKTMGKVNDLTAKRLKWVREAIDVAEKNDKHRIAWKYLRGLIEAVTEDQATKCLKMIAKDKEDRPTTSAACILL